MTTPRALSDELLAAYRNTDYSFTNGSQTIVIRLDEINPELMAFLEQERISSWAYLTAWNPYSMEESAEFNNRQQQLLLEKLKGYKVCKGEGKGRDGNWPGEDSFFVAGISREEACALGRQFGQNAILVSRENKEPELIILV